MAVFATVDGVRYSWRTTNRADFDVMARGVRPTRREGRSSATTSGHLRRGPRGLAGFARRGYWRLLLQGFDRARTIINETKAVNLSVRDLPSGWAATSESLLSDLFSTPNKVITSTTVTTMPPAKTSTWARMSALFQRCIGVSATKDRMYGAAGQQPDYQVSSPVFSASTNGGEEVASAAQYYRTTTMVRKDTAEMRDVKFGACFAQTNAALLESVYTKDFTHVPVASDWQPVTFEPRVLAWRRG